MQLKLFQQAHREYRTEYTQYYFVAAIFLPFIPFPPGAGAKCP
jgi:hypothetical protein